MFFPNQDLLHESSQKSSESAKDEVPGANYFKKILDFWKNHYKSRQLFMEFVKGGCLASLGNYAGIARVVTGLVQDVAEYPSQCQILKTQCITWTCLQHHLLILKERQGNQMTFSPESA